MPAIIIDTREQEPYTFDGFETRIATLRTGDYSLEGFESRIVIERKSKADAYGCAGAGRGRFERCLARLTAFERKAVVIEASLADLAIIPPYIDTRNPHHTTGAKAVRSAVSWSMRYDVPFWLAGNRAMGERLTVLLFAKFLKHVAKGGGR